ncbi:helix-turn-helix domain-containing protein [Nostoc sp.]|uniref:helix-turn-helix domain-containing protein n=1 Tax=Nostoc sp. TaxID=1180 RepID=UPI002FF7FAAE
MRQRQAAKKDCTLLYWLKSGQVSSRRSLAELLGRDQATRTRWVRKYKDEGIRGLLEVKHAPGKVPSLSGKDLERLKKRLQEPSGFQSYGQIQQWIKSELGLSVAYKTVYEVVRNRLGAKLKVPRPQSTKQQE